MNIYVRSQNHDLCKYLSDKDMSELSGKVKELVYPGATVISHLGDRIDSFVVVIEGELEMVTAKGTVLGQIYTGEMAHELHYVKECAAPCELRTRRPSKVAVISFADVDRFIGDDFQRAARIQAAINDSLCLKNIRLTHMEI